MTQNSMFWPTNGIGDGSATGYTSDLWAWYNRMAWTNDPTTQGVSLGHSNSLNVTNPVGVTVRLQSGAALVYGFPYRNTIAVDFTLTTPVINTTGWRLVLRADWAAQMVRAVLLESADGVAAIPAGTQTAGVTWDISLASGTITVVPVVAITDLRSYLEPGIEIDNGHIPNRTRNFTLDPHMGREFPATNLFREDGRGLLFADNVQCAVYGWFVVPQDYVSDLVIVAVTIPLAAGNVFCNQVANYATCGQDYQTTENQTGDVAVPVLAQPLYNCIADLTLTAPNPGDFVLIEFSRDATDILDTVGNSMYFVGWYIHYIADS